jgi:D-xylose transport system permease protein
MKRTLALSIAIPFIWLLFHVWSDGAVLTAGNLNNLFKYLSVVGILATGMTVVLAAGLIDLSVGSVLGFLGALAAFLLAKGLGAPLALAISLGAAIVLGSMHGVVVAYLKVPAFIATLSGLMAYMGAKQWLANPVIALRDPFVLQLGQGYLQALPSIAVAVAIFGFWLLARLVFHRPKRWWLEGLALAFGLTAALALFLSDRGLPVCVLLLLAAAFAAHVLTEKTRFGRHVYAMGSNREAALYAGLPLQRITIAVFALMGVYAWLAGLVASSQLMAAAADIGDYQELYAIAACVIGGTSLSGGTGKVWMSLLGALLMASILNGMEQVGIPSTWQKVILGLILTLAVAVDQWVSRKVA